MRTVAAARMREIDRLAREKFGIPELILMEHAGKAAAEAARRFYRKGPGVRVVVLCGGGANGGDGFVAARHLDNWGVPVRVVLLAIRAKIQGASRINFEILRKMGVPVNDAASLSGWERLAVRLKPAVVVDAMLGTGVSGAVREPVASAIRWTNRQRCPVVAVDVPSGLSSDTGEPCGEAVKATATVTFGLPKRGLLRGRGRELSGKVSIADISLPKELTR